jgi:hypothetical protein
MHPHITIRIRAAIALLCGPGLNQTVNPFAAQSTLSPKSRFSGKEKLRAYSARDSAQDTSCATPIRPGGLFFQHQNIASYTFEKISYS